MKIIGIYILTILLNYTTATAHSPVGYVIPEDLSLIHI